MSEGLLATNLFPSHLDIHYYLFIPTKKTGIAGELIALVTKLNHTFASWNAKHFLSFLPNCVVRLSCFLTIDKTILFSSFPVIYLLIANNEGCLCALLYSTLSINIRAQVIEIFLHFQRYSPFVNQLYR